MTGVLGAFVPPPGRVHLAGPAAAILVTHLPGGNDTNGAPAGLVVVAAVVPDLVAPGALAVAPIAAGRVGFRLVIQGRAAAYATTPHAARQDPVLTVARLIDLADRMARARGVGCFSCVGEVNFGMAVAGAIPDQASITLWFDHLSATELARLAAQFPREAGFVARDAATQLTVDSTWTLAPLAADPAIIAALRAAGGGKFGDIILPRALDDSGLDDAIPRLFIGLGDAALNTTTA